MTKPERTPRVHVLEIPVVWFLLQLLEYTLLILVFQSIVPESWPVSIDVSLAVAILGAFAFVNYRIRRRFIPH